MLPPSSPVDSIPVQHLVQALLARAAAAGHRAAMVVAGTREWVRQAAMECAGLVDGEQRLWISDQVPDGFEGGGGNQARKALGREFDLVVLDAHAGLDPDALGAVSGALKGGGLFLLLTPPLQHWPDFDDPEYQRIAVYPFSGEHCCGRFLKRLAGVIAEAPEITLLQEGEPCPPPPAAAPVVAAAPAVGECRTPDQQAAVEAIAHVAHGHRRRPLVLTSDRGRGKSSAFGIAAARLLQGTSSRILVTGPRLEAVAPVFQQAARCWPGATASRGLVCKDGRELRFLPPDALLQEAPAADLLLVDEAAAIPTPLLEQLLRRYARIAFATTVHGYEGTGRGFALRFHRVLDRDAPGWKSLRMDAPIRWAVDDPLERFVFRALLLDAAIAEAPEGEVDPGGCAFVEFHRDELLEDPGTLSQLFGLLVLAHYRTRPYDLRQLLDGPNLGVFGLRRGGDLVATALLALEGGLPDSLADQVYGGHRRVRGHLIPQSLLAHGGISGAGGCRGARVMRIAVHPRLQGRGLGSRLLQQMIEHSRARGLDWIGTSFGVSPALLGFWRRNGLEPVRIGVNREAASGSHAALMMKSLNGTGDALFRRARERFMARFPEQLAESLQDLEPELVRPLLLPAAQAGDRPSPGFAPAGGHDGWRELVAFAFASRGYEDSAAAVRPLVLNALADGPVAAGLAVPLQSLLIRRVLQRHGWSRCARLLGLTGKGEARALLREAVQPLVRHYGGDSVVDLIDSFVPPGAGKD